MTGAPTPPDAAGPLAGLGAGVTLDAARRTMRDAFRAAGLDGPDLDARLLAGHALGLDLTGLVRAGGRPLAPGEAERLAALARRRIAGEPVARILGTQEFRGLELALGPDTLVPRPDTETLVEVALARLGGNGIAAALVADLGTGSGAILAALLDACPTARGIGTDIAPGALAVAAGNLARLGLAGRALLARGSFADALKPAAFDLIVSNPPYIATAVIAGLDREVREHDPRLALDGGADGLDAYRALIGRAAEALVPGGTLAVEIGYDQAEAVAALFVAAGLETVAVTRDLGGNDRVVAGDRPAAR